MGPGAAFELDADPEDEGALDAVACAISRFAIGLCMMVCSIFI